ncbi:MAG: hypothetical protein IKR06_01200 [Erysipelotrichaceae bacterium]|nr:hypothetical protein [Erysipelotrichaceae bacterium]MBR4121886.1 hypothetical protein [Erysipelotrichaceae bacterium]
MKKLILLLFTLCLLISGCSQKEKTPEELLQEAYAKAEQLDSMTITGMLDLTVSAGSELVIPIDLLMKVERGDKADPKDDLSYTEITAEVFGQLSNTKTWVKDGVSYVETADRKYIGDTAETPEPAAFDAGKMAKAIAENAESITAAKSGDSTVITVKPTKKLIAAILEAGSAEEISGDLLNNEVLESLTFDDILITIGKEGYVDNILISAAGEVEGVNMKLSLDLTVSDRNATKVPEFDPAEFTDEPETEPEPTDVSDDSKMLEVTFEEDGVTAGFEAEKDSNIAIVFDEEESFVDIYDANYENERALGLFVGADMTDELLDAVRTGKDGYELREEATTAIGPYVIGYSPQETDIFNPDTIFLAMRYEGYDLGYVMVGFGSEEDFLDLLDNLSFYTK